MFGVRSSASNGARTAGGCYDLTREYDGKRATVKDFSTLLNLYQKHPEAKSLGPDGNPCDYKTRGLLQRAHVVANDIIYIGKESDRHLEEAEDLSLLEFRAVEYRPKGSAIATDEQISRISKIPTRELMRRGINQHTLEKIVAGKAVRVASLLKCLKALEEKDKG